MKLILKCSSVVFVLMLGLSIAFSDENTNAVPEKPKLWVPEKIPFELPTNENLQIYLLMGQSNMVGMDRTGIESQTINPRIGYNTSILVDGKGQNVWLQAIFPMTRNNQGWGIGPGISFANEMLKDASTDIKIGLQPLAVAGTPLSMWEKEGKNNVHYQSFVYAVRESQKRGVIKGIIWHQGESDSMTMASSETYKVRLIQAFKDYREEVGDPNLPIVVGQLGNFVAPKKLYPGLDLVKQALSEMPAALPNVAFVDSNGLTDKGDKLHFNSASQIEFGKRYAEAMKELQKNPVK